MKENVDLIDEKFQYYGYAFQAPWSPSLVHLPTRGTRPPRNTLIWTKYMRKGLADHMN